MRLSVIPYYLVDRQLADVEGVSQERRRNLALLAGLVGPSLLPAIVVIAGNEAAAAATASTPAPTTTATPAEPTTGTTLAVVPTVEPGTPFADGAAALKTARFNARRVDVTGTDTPRDQVIRQDPAGGEFRSPGTTVTLFVSGGDAPSATDLKTVPKVLGKSANEAVRLIEAAGLDATVLAKFVDPKDQQIGLVVAQNPSPGSRVAANDDVEITVPAPRRAAEPA